MRHFGSTHGHPAVGYRIRSGWASRPWGANTIPLVSFQQEAKKAESNAVAMGLRVLALCHCAQRYSPIGFRATLDFLELKAGPYRDSEDALVSAITMLRQAHSLWQEELSQYAAQRSSAKRAGQRSPRPRDANPNVLRTWHGREKEAALFAVRRWLDLAGERGSSEGPERTLRGLADRAMASSFSTQDRGSLDTLLRELDASASWMAYQADSQLYFRDRRLGFIAHQLHVAVDATG